jgi:A/G-specific adenine glycosylase
MMHRAAQVVVSEHGGIFPRTAEALLALPGIGAYTAAAVASIAFGEPVAVVDGNVERVLARVYALDGAAGAKSRVSTIRRLADELIDPEHPSHFNQAMMEMGATVCLPRGPLCLQCPLQPMCLTRGEHATVRRTRLLPRDAFYALIEKEQEVLLEQRPADASLMAGMWQLPELAAPADAKPVCTLKHSITVTNYTVRVYEADLGSVSRAHAWQGQWFPLSAVNELALTGLARKVLRRIRREDI